MKRRANSQAAVDRWNRAHPVGTRVTVRKDSGEVVETVTRTEASVLSGHTAVIWLEGISGCYLLDRVTAIASERAGKPSCAA